MRPHGRSAPHSAHTRRLSGPTGVALSWPELVEVLTRHTVGRKEGTCIVPAVFRGDQRAKSDAERIDVAFLDSDAGATLDEIATAAQSAGWAAVVSSTHSHLTTFTKAKQENWRKFKAARSADAEAAYLVEVKGMLPRVAAGATVASETEEFVFLQHQPCAKFRVAIPLQRPWLAADYPSQDVANAVWKERIEFLAAALGLTNTTRHAPTPAACSSSRGALPMGRPLKPASLRGRLATSSHLPSRLAGHSMRTWVLTPPAVARPTAGPRRLATATITSTPTRARSSACGIGRVVTTSS